MDPKLWMYIAIGTSVLAVVLLIIILWAFLMPGEGKCKMFEKVGDCQKRIDEAAAK